jgi:hypothetical protein
MARPNSRARDLRLDLFRGLALWFIFLDHIPGNVFSWVTIRNYGFSDATEIFVFISGYTATLVYGRAMQEHGLLPAAVRVLKRVWQIYVAHILLCVVLIALVAVLALGLGDPHLFERMGLGQFLGSPERALVAMVSLQFKPANTDVLPLYIALLAGFAPVLWLLVRRPGVALAASVGLYAVAKALGWNIASFPGGEWVFNPFAWQLMFVLGACCALGRPAFLGPLGRSRPFAAVGIVYLAFALFIVASWQVPALQALVPGWLAGLIYPISKPNLDLLRLLHFLAIAGLASRLVGRDSAVLRLRLASIAVRCGQHSLEIFCLGIVLAFLGEVAVARADGSLLAQAVASVAGIAVMVAAATLLSLSKAVDSRKAGGQLAAA